MQDYDATGQGRGYDRVYDALQLRNGGCDKTFVTVTFFTKFYLLHLCDMVYLYNGTIVGWRLLC